MRVAVYLAERAALDAEITVETVIVHTLKGYERSSY